MTIELSVTTHSSRHIPGYASQLNIVDLTSMLNNHKNTIWCSIAAQQLRPSVLDASCGRRFCSGPVRLFKHLFLVLWLGLLATSLHAEIRPDFLMDSDPDIPEVEKVQIIRKDLVPLWIQALERPEVDLQRMTADSISLAKPRKVADLEKTVPALENILTAKGSHPVARFSAAKALIAIDSRQSAQKLLDASTKYGADLRRFIEPTLAEWDFGPARSVWKHRIEEGNARPRDLILAIRGLAAVRESSALPLLTALAQNGLRPVDIRLEAASAAGLLTETGLESICEPLLNSSRGDPTVQRLCVLRLLARHQSDSAIDTFKKLAVETEPSVAALALKRLNDINPDLVLPLVEQSLSSPDVHVREQGAIAYLSRPTVDRVVRLSQVLDDPQPALRRHVCQTFLELAAQPELNDAIRSSTMDVMSRDSWRGQEQGALLLGQLQHSAAAPRLCELLESPRPEVMVASAWSLRKVANLISVPAIMDKIRRQTAARKISTTEHLDHQVAHLLEACGTMRVKEAEPLMMEYVPKNPIMGERSRTAAIWALGWLYVGTPNENLGRALWERITDYGLMPPEFKRVKLMCVVGYGRMKSEDYVEPLRQLHEQTRFGNAIRWTLHEINGEWLPLPPPESQPQGTWFLEPIDEPAQHAR
jgi:HEAT repeat protein